LCRALRPLGSRVAQAAPGREVGGPRPALAPSSAGGSGVARPAHPGGEAEARRREHGRVSLDFGLTPEAVAETEAAARDVRARPSETWTAARCRLPAQRSRERRRRRTPRTMANAKSAPAYGPSSPE